MITLDVGNSSVGVGRLRDGELVVWRGQDLADVARRLVALADDGEVVGIDVAPARWKALGAAIEQAGGEAPRRLQGVPLQLADERLAGSAGADRMAAALAVTGPAVVVDAGTAVTLELVAAGGIYLGGFIAPGPRAALAGLAASTAVLPALEGGRVPIVPGVETTGALSAGAWGLAVGGVDRLVEQALAQPGLGDATVWATGGWGARWAADSRRDDVRVDEVLVHRGIRRWAAG